MADFNPDEYLKQKVGGNSGGGGFDPDAYLKEKSGGSWLDTKLPFETSPRGLIQGTLNTLPTVGMIGGGAAGGLAGTAAAPGVGTAVGAVGGAGLGAGLGEGVKQMGEEYILGKPRKGLAESSKAAGTAMLEGASGEAGGQAMGAGLKIAGEVPIVKKGINKAKDIGAKLGETLTGISKQDIKTYANNANEIKKMIKESDGSVPLAADEMRDKWMKGVQEEKTAINGQISKALETEGNKVVDPKSVIEAMEAHKARVNPELYPEELKSIDEVIGKVKKLSDEGGNMTAKNANDLRKYLQEVAAPAYGKPGQVFQYGDQTQQAAKKGAAQIRDLLNKEIPAIKEANSKLAKFHDLEDDMNRNLLASGKPEAAVMAAGSGGNARSAMNLEKLGKMSGQDMVSDAQNLSAMRTFNNPAWLPVDPTGKSLTRLGAGTALGTLAGYGIGGKEGALAGGAMGGGLTSPAMLKAAIDAGLISKGLLNKPDVYNAIIKGLIQNKLEEKR